MDNKPNRIVVIGASAGGLQAVTEVLAQLTTKMDIAVFVVLHVAQNAMGDLLVQRIQKQTAFTCKIAVHNEEIKTQHVYMAVADSHLVIKEGKMVLGDGPQENRWRPSIDVLFRSAAAAYNARTIGIILTGLLTDGTAGMQAVKRCGGITIVQDPREAEYPDMPLSVISNMEVDYCVPLSDIGTILFEKSDGDVASRLMCRMIF